MGKIQNAFSTGTLENAINNIAENAVDSTLGQLSPLNDFGRYFTGSRAIIKVNDELIGFAFSVSFNISTTQDPIYTIDEWLPWELAPQRVAVTGTLGMFHIPGRGPTANTGMMQNVLSFMKHKYITIDIRDQQTDNTIFKTDKAVITGRRQRIQAGEPSSIELTWMSIGWVDEKQPSDPTDPPNSEPRSLLDRVPKLF